MAPYSSTLAWKIPWTEEPSRLQSMGSRRVGHNWVTSLSLFTFMPWRRKWQPTPAFLPGESQGRGSLVGCRLWGRTESDMTEATQHTTYYVPGIVLSTVHVLIDLIHITSLWSRFNDNLHFRDKETEAHIGTKDLVRLRFELRQPGPSLHSVNQ